MSAFKDAFVKIGESLADLSSLEVKTYKGSVSLSALTNNQVDFDSILANAKTQADFKLVASTKSELDGDTTVFYDKDASAAEIEAHTKLWDSAMDKRAAVVQLFEAAIKDAIK